MKKLVCLILACMIACSLFACTTAEKAPENTDAETTPESTEEIKPEYTYLEIKMYETMILGYESVMDLLVNPTTASFWGFKYDTKDNLALFYLTSENRVGGKVTTYAIYNGNSGWTSVSDNQKDNYKEADVELTADQINEYIAYRNSNEG